MFVDRNLKKLLLGLSALALAVAPGPATAKPSAKLCPHADQLFVVQVDEKTVICREPRPLRSLGVEDMLVLYRYCTKESLGSKDASNMTFINFRASNISTVSITEYKSCSRNLKGNRGRMTSFSLKGRKFHEWLYPEDENLELLNRYRGDVTRLLDTAEKFPAKPTF